LAARVQLREITSEEGNRLLRIVRRTSGSVVTWRRAQIVLLAAQGMSAPRISEVVFTDPDTVREVIHNFNRDGFDALYPRYRGGRPQTFTLPKRHEIKRIALTDPQDLDQPFATWSLSKLADYLVAEGVVTDISHEGLRQLLRQEGVRFLAVRTWKRSNDPDFQAKRDRIVELYARAEAGEAVVICLDEFGPLNLQPQPGGHGWAPRAKPKRIRATFTRPHGIRHLISAYDVGADRLYGHIKRRKGLRRVPRVLPLHPQPLPARDPPAFRAGQLQRPQGRASPRMGRQQQRRTRLHALLRLLAKPHRSAVPRAALLHARRHRPPRPRHPGATDPPLHRLAQPQHRQPPPPRPRQHGQRCLTLH
jgi:transposase